jgi:high-affinity iron transporter
MLSTLIIALREGLEAALIVGILVAYLVRSERVAHLKALWSGVVIAIVASLGLGAILSFTSSELGDRGEKIFAGTSSFIAVGLVTWMVFWMQRTARSLRADLHGKLDNAVHGGAFAIGLVAFFAVVREGLETSLFIYSNFKTHGGIVESTFGLVTGFAIAITLGVLLYKRSVKLNLSKFFTISGVALIVVAAGVLSYGVHEFQELGWLPGVDWWHDDWRDHGCWWPDFPWHWNCNN